MKNTDWKETAELIGIAAIVASLIFVGLQMQQAADIARAELVSGNLASEIEASAVFIENADIWRRGNAGEDLEANESVIFQELVGIRTSSAFWQSDGFRWLGLPSDVPPAAFAAFLCRNPGARSVWQERADEVAKFRNPIISDETRDFSRERLTFGRDVEAGLKTLEDMYGCE